MPIATSGVIPGSTPISVPSATPAKQYGGSGRERDREAEREVLNQGQIGETWNGSLSRNTNTPTASAVITAGEHQHLAPANSRPPSAATTNIAASAATSRAAAARAKMSIEATMPRTGRQSQTTGPGDPSSGQPILAPRDRRRRAR